MVFAALHRPNGNAVRALQVRYSGESGSPLASCVMTLANEKVRQRRYFELQFLCKYHIPAAVLALLRWNNQVYAN